MTDNKLTDSITTSTTQLDLEGKTVKQETDEISPPDFVPHFITAKSEIIDNITEPNEKNGQKRIQPAPIDGASKKPRIDTPEDSSAETEQLEQEMVLSTEPVEQVMVLRTELVEQEMVFKNEQEEQEMVLKDNREEQEMVHKNEQEEQEMVLRTDEGEHHMDQSSDTEEYYLTVHNLPTDWTYVQIKDFLDQECGHVDEMEMLKHRKSKSCAIRLTFQNFDKCTEMFNKLENKYVQDKKLNVKISDTYTTFPTGVTIPSTVRESLTKQLSISNEVIAATRRRRVSFNQLEALWEILNENRALATGYNKTCHAREHSKRMWHFAAATLNSQGDGAEKDWKSWCKYWNDYKSKLKHKVARARASMQMTGEGPSNQERLTDLELKFIQMLGEDFGSGLPGARVESFDIFRCDKTELREVMELAGNVLMCCVVYSISKYAKVMYSHPLEAVQAISMLNGQLFYGTPLKIIMDKNPADSVVLPKGLVSIGQGLGIKARPIRNIVQQYHRYAKKQSSTINPLVFSEIDFTNEHNIFKTEENTEEIKGKIREFATLRPGCNVLNPTVKVDNIEEIECPEPVETDISMPETTTVTKTKRSRRNRAGSQDPNKKGAEKQQSNSPKLAGPGLSGAAPNPLIRLGNPSGGFIHPNLLMNPAGTMPIPVPCDPFFRPDNNHHQQDPRPFRPRVPFMLRPPFPQPRPPFGSPAAMGPQIPPNFSGPRPLGSPVTVKFSNLPPSTTFPLLCELLAKCGQVMSVQLTTPGCAVATFGHPNHADRCFLMFNGKNVDGYTIEVDLV